MSGLVPGEILTAPGDITLNDGAEVTTIIISPKPTPRSTLTGTRRGASG